MFKSIFTLLTSLLDSKDFINLFKGKESKKLEFALKLSEMIDANNLAQIEVNKKEAEHKKLFVSGWRPFIGWCGGLSLAYNFIFQPFMVFILLALDYDVSPPELEITQLITIILGMLGMSSMRTYEKLKKNKDA